jgi:hypothetical protein
MNGNEIVKRFWALLEENACYISGFRQGDFMRASIPTESKLKRLVEFVEGIELVPPRSKNTRVVVRNNRLVFLYALGSSGDRGFWGVDKNIVENLNHSGKPWALILLHKNESSGYWFEAEQVRELTQGVWHLGSDGYSFKINAPNDVVDAIKFSSPQKLLELAANFIQRGAELPTKLSP